MKVLKKRGMFLLIALLGISLVFTTSCDKDDNDTVVTKTILAEKLTEAKTLVAASEEGLAAGQFAYGSIATLQAVIDIAQAVNDNVASTQTVVDNTVISLTEATTAFNDAEITPIAANDLVGHWTFDDASGTTVKDYSGNSLNGTFKTGIATFGAGNPTWATDRYGKANKAISFNKGAFVEVPYNAAINPKQITITVWVNAAEIRENNRFLGLHSWNGYKFQLQGANKSFFTANIGEAKDKDTEPALELNKWYHLGVTFGGGEMVFYINGVKTQTHTTELTGDLVTVSEHNLVFGVGSSKYAATTDNYNTDKIIPAEWGGYFNGSIDEIRIYKSVLTETQIASIYALEKLQD